MTMTALSPQLSREQIYQDLCPSEQLEPNQHWLARMLASWMTGDGVLPDYLGLEPGQFESLLQQFFPDADISSKAASGIQPDPSRMPEKQDLVDLMLLYSRDQSEQTHWVIGLIVAACMGSDHLWQDLGLWQRSELTELISYNFPQLAERNTKDMKWKKFLYKQLCEAEGLYLCRAPSCEVCADYNNCYNTEKD